MHGEYTQSISSFDEAREHLLEDLNKRLERLVSERSSLAKISEDKRRHVANKFANKSLQELNEIALNLPSY